MITHHTQLLQALIDKHNLKSYLEIGVQNPANNFELIRCDYKFGVDPEIKKATIGQMFFIGTSDEYFDQDDEPIYKKFDLIFIDGDHTADQVKRDFENSLKCLNDNGFIVIHDCLPEKEETTHVPRKTKVWHGDVYKFCMSLGQYEGIRFVTYDIDNGCCLVWKDKEAKKNQPQTHLINWDTYKALGLIYMNVVGEVII